LSIYKATSVVANTLKGETMAARGDTKLYFPGLGSTYDSLADWAYPLIRITAGLMLLPHVWPKLMTAGAAGVAAGLARRGIEPALPFAYLIMFLELVGGICIAIGFLTRPFALLCLIEMIVIIFKAHLPNGWGFSVQGGGAEFPVMWAILFLVILIRGGGPFSVDRALGKEF
jgi:putative oxidoreductase